MTFNDRVEELLKKKGVTKKELAGAVGFATQSFYDWKQRGTIPSAETVCGIARYLGTSAEFLVTGTEAGGYREKYSGLVGELKDLLAKYGE